MRDSNFKQSSVTCQDYVICIFRLVLLTRLLEKVSSGCITSSEACVNANNCCCYKELEAAEVANHSYYFASDQISMGRMLGSS